MIGCGRRPTPVDREEVVADVVEAPVRDGGELGARDAVDASCLAALDDDGGNVEALSFGSESFLRGPDFELAVEDGCCERGWTFASTSSWLLVLLSVPTEGVTVPA